MKCNKDKKEDRLDLRKSASSAGAFMLAAGMIASSAFAQAPAKGVPQKQVLQGTKPIPVVAQTVSEDKDVYNVDYEKFMDLFDVSNIGFVSAGLVKDIFGFSSVDLRDYETLAGLVAIEDVGDLLEKNTARALVKSENLIQILKRNPQYKDIVDEIENLRQQYGVRPLVPDKIDAWQVKYNVSKDKVVMVYHIVLNKTSLVA